MVGRNSTKEEYELVAYPKLNHVYADVVQIINRNTHVHGTMEIGLVLEGEGTVLLHEKEFVIQKGSVFFFNANDPHEIVAANQDGIKIAYIQIAGNFCGEYIPALRNLEFLRNDLSSVLTEEQLYQVTESIVLSMKNYLADANDRYALNCISSICGLFSKLLQYVPYRQTPEAVYSAKNKKMARLSRITEYIDANSGEKITLEELANLEKVTKTYLSHFIHDHLHMTFQEYVSSVRFEQALKLIRSTTMCLTDISIISGFSDVKYLSRMLEKRFGASAQECCAMLRGNADLISKEQAQTFASKEAGERWLEQFWTAYSQRERKEKE